MWSFATGFFKISFNIYFYLFICVSVVAHGIFNCSVQTPSCTTWDQVPWPGIEPKPLGAWSLSHWTPREVLGFFHLIQCFQGSSMSQHVSTLHFFSFHCQISCIGILQFVFPSSVNRHVFPVFGYKWTILLLTFMCKFYEDTFSFLLGIDQRVELLNHAVILCLKFLRTAKLISTAAALFSLHFHQYVGGFWSLHILANICYHLPFNYDHLHERKVVSMVLIFIFLLTNNIEHIFMCLLAICISTLEKCLFTSLPVSKFGWFVFLFLNYEKFFMYSKYELPNCFAGTCSHFVGCFFLFSRDSFAS